jgi:hypothetical protein
MTPDELAAIEARAQAIYVAKAGDYFSRSSMSQHVCGTDIPAMAAHIRAQDAEVKRLREALDFYACVDHYPIERAQAPEVVRDDGGRRARGALSPAQEDKRD